MSSYQLDNLFLDLGDLGQMPVVVDGYVHESGLFGDGNGYVNATIERVVLHIESKEIDVTHLLSPAARADIEETLTRHYESERMETA